MDNESGRSANDWAYRLAGGPVYQMTVRGSEHFNYSDLSLWSLLFRRAGLTGSISAGRMVEIINGCALAFFERYLKNREMPVLAGSDAVFPEVIFQSRGGHPASPEAVCE